MIIYKNIFIIKNIFFISKRQKKIRLFTMGKESCKKVQIISTAGKATRGTDATLIAFDGGSTLQTAAEITLGEGCHDGQVKSVIVSATNNGYYKLIDQPLHNGIFFLGSGNITLNLIWIEACRSWQLLDNAQDSKAPALINLDDGVKPFISITDVARADIKFLNISTPYRNKDKCACDAPEQEHVYTVLRTGVDCTCVDLIKLNYVDGTGWESTLIKELTLTPATIYPNQILSSNGRAVVVPPESTDPQVQATIKVYSGATFGNFDQLTEIALAGVIDATTDVIESVTINEHGTQIAVLLKQLSGAKYANVYEVLSGNFINQYIAPVNAGSEPLATYFFLYNSLVSFQNGDEVFVGNPQTTQRHFMQYLKGLGENTDQLASTSLADDEFEHLHVRLPTSDATAIVSKQNSGLPLDLTGDGRYLHTVEVSDGDLYSLNMHFMESDIYQQPLATALPGVVVTAMAVSRSGEALIFNNTNDGLIYLLYPELDY